MGTNAIPAWQLIQQLEQKVREKNSIIEEIGKVLEIEGEAFDIGNDVITEVKLLLETNTKLVESLKESRDESHYWRTKYILMTMLGYKNPIPLGVGVVVGGLLGQLIMKVWGW